MSAEATLVLVAAAPPALALVWFAAWRPAWAGALLVLAVPLTAGIRSRSSLPLGPDQAIVLCVFLGAMAYELRRPRPLAFTGLDLAVIAFAGASVLVPIAVLTLQHVTPDSTTLRLILLPAQYLLIYVVFARAPQDERTLPRTLHMAMLAGVIVGAVAIAEAVLPAARSAVAAVYVTPVLEPWDPVYRPGSLLGFYSAVGAMGLLSFTLALAVAATRSKGFSAWWLSLVMAVGLVAIVASQTWTALAVLPLVTLIICVYTRRVPAHLLAVGAALAAGLVVLWPAVAARLGSQLHGGAGQTLALPETLATRVSYWTKFFIPAYVDHGLWLGTGTVLPSEVPPRLVPFVDSEYLAAGFRGGLVLIAVLVTLLVAIVVAGWTLRRRSHPLQRSLGAIAVAFSLAFAVLGTTSEYLTFAGVSQQFWMAIGLLALTVTPAATGNVVVIRGRRTPRQRLGVTAARLRAALPPLVGSSAIVFLGVSVARLLGFGFSVAAARLLPPSEFGQMTYALVVATVGSVLLTSAPIGLSSYLSRYHAEPDIRRGYYASWLTLVGLVVVASAALTLAAAPLSGLGGWLLAGVLCNLLGVAALETYREVLRGIGRYVMLSSFYAAANLLQLLAILLAGLLGVASASLCVIVYGLSSFVLLLATLAVKPVGIPFEPAAVRWPLMREAWRMAWPLMLQSIFFAVWFGADLLLLQRLAGPVATGHYGAAKTLASALFLAPAAIGFVLAPVVARQSMASAERHLWPALGIAAATVVPAAFCMAALARALVALLFGPGYANAAAVLPVLVVGIAAYGLYSVYASLWTGLRRPMVDTVCTALAMVATIAAAVLLIARLGALGAAWAFTAGSLVKLAAIAGYTLIGLGCRAGPLGVPLAVIWRLGWRVVEALRGRLFRDPVGYPRRPQLEPAVDPGRSPGGAGTDAVPEMDEVGVLTASVDSSAAIQGARLLGLKDLPMTPEGASAMARWAAAAKVPLVVVGCPVGIEGGRALAGYAEQGGTVLVTGEGLDEASSTGLGVPARAAADSSWAMELAYRVPSLTHELSGATVRTELPAFLADCERGTVLARAVSNAGRRPLVVSWPRGGGAIMASATPDRVPSSIGDGVLHPGSLLPVLMLLRNLYGERAWRPPLPLANITVDDPALRLGRPGVDYLGLLAAAEDHRFHITVATVPRELVLAERAVVGLLAGNREHVTACYHGNDHSGYEFFDPQARRRRYAGRSLDWQRRAVAEAADRGRAFAGRTGLALDRVMVFPHGIGPPGVLPALDEQGFLGTVNQGDRYPMGSTAPLSPFIGLRPADTCWEGFPLIWRRPLADAGGLLLDLFLGRPAIAFAHHKEIGPALRPLVDRAGLFNRVPGLRWGGLETIALHGYVTRHDPERGWLVLMTANEICLHNPGSRPRRYLVRRPDAPTGSSLVAGSAAASGPELAVVVAARSSVRVRLRRSGSAELPQPPPDCPLAPVPDGVTIAETA
jgi:O-antigen/teichoic acid export membrane protein